MNGLLDVWVTLLSFSKYFLSNTFSQNIDKCSVAFLLFFSTYIFRSLFVLLEFVLMFMTSTTETY